MEYSQLAEKTDSIIKLITKWGESIYDFCGERNENDFSEFLEKGIKFYRDDKDSSIIMSNNNSTLMLFFNKKDSKSAIREKYYYNDLLDLVQLNLAYKHYSLGCKTNYNEHVIAKILEKSDSKSSLETLKDIIKNLKQTVNDNEVDTFFDAIEKTINNVNKYLNKKNKYIEDNLRDFKTTNLKEQVEIINYYKTILEAIEEGKKAGKKANMSDEEITTFIAKRYLGIEDIEEYYAFIEYAKKCISQEDSIISKYNFMYAIPESIDDTVKKTRSLTMKR